MALDLLVISIGDFFRCIRERLDEAAAIPKATEACAEAVKLDEAVGIVHIVQYLVCDVTCACRKPIRGDHP
jgi:hypothetical protein